MDMTIGVFNSDRINRYNMVFPLATLVAALEQRWATGTPNYLGHDRHRLIGWSRPLGIHLQGGLARLTGLCMLSETRDDQKLLALRAQQFTEMITEAHVGPHVAELQRRLGDRLTPSHGWIEAGCAAVVDPGLAVGMFPEIFARRDKDGLVPLSELQELTPGVFEKDGLLIFAHRYFRRALSRHNTLNTPFLKRFSDLPAALNPRIALDEDMIGLASTLAPTVELEYWWGPKFTDDLSSLQEGITLHQATDDERILHGLLRTEFWWYRQDDRRTFEAEELPNVPSGGLEATAFGCRFVHSMLDGQSTPTHMDGAVRLYAEEAMISRIDCNIYEAGRRAGYHKLWRIDGELSVETWKALLSDYFRDNHLVGEYLGAPAPLSDEVATASAAVSDPLAPFVPYNLSPNDGVHVHVSFHDPLQTESGRSIRVLDSLTNLKDTLSFIDSGAVELIKLLRRNGESIIVPPNTERVLFTDMMLQIPLIAHTGPDAVVLAGRTLTAVAKLCERLNARGDDRLMSFTLAIDYGDREVWFSVAGHVADLQQWFAAGIPNLPSTTADIVTWLDSVYTLLNRLFPGDHDSAVLHQLLQPSGMLVFTRRFLDPAVYSFVPDEKKSAIFIQMRLPPDSDEAAMLQSGRLQVASAHVIRRSSCTLCGKPYWDCPCCKFLDDGVGQIIEEAPVVGAYWTNRKA